MIERDLFGAEHRVFRDTVARFVRDELLPHHDAWESAGCVPHEPWLKAGAAGLLGCNMPERYGGSAGGFLYTAIVVEEMSRALATGPLFWIHSDIIAPYILHWGTDAQKERWLPRLVNGEVRSTVALTEPGAGSDLAAISTTARRDGGDWVINGQKVFISGGHSAELAVVAAKTDPAAGSRGISLFLVETDRPGFERGRKLQKLGLRGQDTAELFFHDLRIPAENLLGTENRGFHQLMKGLAGERVLQAIRSQAVAEAAIEWTVEHVCNRRVFGQRLADLQNTRFKLGELTAQTSAMRVYVDRLISLQAQGLLDGVEAAKAKLVTSELHCKVVDECLQLFGGSGFMLEMPIARAYADARGAKIMGGSVEVMKEIIGRDLLGDARRAA
jgi:alkylation response protein AidB-like acyl-CoA dehydrogenase